MVRMRTENKSISMEKDVSATYAPTTLGLYRNRTAIYTSKWTEEARAKNRITGASMSESYRYASRIDRESMMFLDENESVMDIEAEFDGMGHVGFLKKGSVSGAESASIFEAREDYVGSFKVLEKTGEYGSAVSSEKSASGEGLVAVDKRVGESQRSYESGTGAYDSEELIETNTNYIAKEISLVSGPMNYSSTDDFSINFDQKWKEGMYSKTAGTNLIGEEYSSIESLDKETVALGPFETVRINHLAEALWSERFTNSFEVDARSVDGSIVQPVRAECVVEVGEFEGETKTVGWQPPDWGFVSVCDENCELAP